MDQILLELPGWTPAGATVWPRARFSCEYCGTLVVGDIGTYKWGQQYDHILPRSKYTSIITEPATATWLQYTGTNYRNIALVCCFCNRLKHDYDPSGGTIPKDCTDIFEEQREKLVRHCQERFGDRGRQQWAAALAEFSKFRERMASLSLE
jgi:hypothetical protein